MSTGIRKPKREQVLIASGASKLVGPIDVSDYDDLTIDLRIAATVALATTTLTILGSNGDPPGDGAFESALTSGALIGPAPTGMTFANGVFTPTSVGAITHTLVGFTLFPAFLYFNWVYGSGGGTLDVRLTLSAW